MSTTARIEIRSWLAKQENLPRIADVTITKRTAKAIQCSGSGSVVNPINCLRCNRELTHPVSQQVGIGPDCCDHLGISWSADTSEEAMAELRDAITRATTFTDQWLPISQIEFLDGQLPARDATPTREAQPKGVNLSAMPAGAYGSIEVTEWIAREKGFGRATTFRGTVKTTTTKALLFLIIEAEFEDQAISFNNLEAWFPFSQIVDADLTEPETPKPRKPGRWNPTWRDVETGEEIRLNPKSETDPTFEFYEVDADADALPF